MTIKLTIKCVLVRQRNNKLWGPRVSPPDQLTVAPTQDPHCLHLQELGYVDEDGAEDGREDVEDDPLGLGLNLPVVVRPADSEEPLQGDTEHDVDAGYKAGGA